jgi:predicted nicotinamide N-methyase
MLGETGHCLIMSSASPLLLKLQEILPAASFETVSIDTSPPIVLNLLKADFPQQDLREEDIQRAMNNPLYWVFCWASGQVLAKLILDNPDWVAGKRILDFGSGSGVVAIAAALAGADEVIACDVDPLALDATRLNAGLNGVSLKLERDYFRIDGTIDLIIVADVLYDQSNFAWLERFLRRADKVLIADSRVRNFEFPHYRQIARCDSRTIPDLDESAEFGDVRIYLADQGC